MSPDSRCGLVDKWVHLQKPVTRFSNSHTTPPHLYALTFDREDPDMKYPADREPVSTLICPEAEIDAVQGLEKLDSFNRHSPGCVTAWLQITKVV